MLAPIGFDWNDAGDAQFSRFLDCPFEAFEFDQCKIEGDEREFRAGPDLFDHAEPDKVLASGLDGSQPGALVIRDLEFLAGLDAQHASQMMGILTGNFGLAFADLINEEAAARHVQLRYLNDCAVAG